MSLKDRLRQVTGSGGGGAGASHLDPRVRMLRDAAVDAQRSRIPQMAAALSYRTIFGMVPIIALALVVLSRLVTEDDLNRFVRSAIDTLGLHGIVTDAASRGTPVLERTAETADLMGPVTAADMKASSLDGWIAQLVDGLRRINFAAIGVVGVLFLIYTAVSMIVEVERAFNQIFRVPRGRSWVRRLTNYTTLLVYAPVCLALTFYLGQRLDTWIADLRESSTYVAPAALVEVVGRLAQVVVTTGLLLVLYTVVPNTRVRPLPALGGAVLAAVLFEALKFGFIEYLRMTGSAKYTRLYGSLALVPLFMLWVYITWAVVLFGLQFTHMLQYGRFRRAAQPLPEAGPMVVEPTAALLVMAGAARGFASGSPQTVAALAATSGLPEGVVGLVVQRLADRGLLHPVEHEVERSPEPWYALSRPPGSVRVAELLSIGFELAGGGEGNETVRRLRRAQIEAAGDETLADAAGLRADGSPQGVQAVAMAARGQGRPVAAGVPGPSPAAAADGNGRPAGGPGAGQGEARPATL